MFSSLEANDISIAKTSRYKQVNDYFAGFDEKFRLVFHTNTSSILPFIHCTNCKKFWHLYKKYQNDGGHFVRSNPRSNIENHLCRAIGENVPIPLFQKTGLGKLRSTVTDFFAELIAKHPTVSVNSGVQILNQAANFVSEMSSKNKKNYLFNISRQNVSETLVKSATEILEQNISNFKINYSKSSIVIDHWSCHGRNSIDYFFLH